MTNESSLIENLSGSTTKTVNYFLSKIKLNGSYGDEAIDLACYFKSPMMFIAAGYQSEADCLLNYIKSQFLFNGDLLTTSDKKSSQQEYAEYWSYPNGWIARAAQKLHRIDITETIYPYLNRYSCESGGFYTHKIDENIDGITDVLTTAHLGLLQLESENVERAIKAGDYLLDVYGKQTNLNQSFYLRLDKSHRLVTVYQPEMTWAHVINNNQPQQAYFMIGYPIAFLTLLYKKTNSSKYLEGAKSYMNFAFSCNEHVHGSNMSHKLAWAAALLLQFDETRKDKYLNLIEKVTNHLINQQSNEGIFIGNINSSFDQSVEVAFWFLEIVRILKENEETL